MSTADEVRKIAGEARIVIDRMLDDAEVMTGLRDAATEKGIDWSQLKALVKAQAQDARDGKNRVGKLVERADFACAYAEMLSGKMNEKHETRSSSDDDPILTISAGGSSADLKLSTLGKIADAAQTETGRRVLSMAVAAVQADGLDLPPFLDRRAPNGAQ